MGQKRILIVSTVSRQFHLFEKENISILESFGAEIHCAANYFDTNENINKLPIIKHHFDIQRSPFSIKNIKAYFQLKKIIKENEFDLIHCHTPMGGLLARLAAKALKFKNVIYTAHGFHFYKGAPLINNIIYYQIEKYMSKYTDTLITMNNEDYERAKIFNARRLIYIPGIGLDIGKFNKEYSNQEKDDLKESFGINEGDIVFLSIGELIKRKNHEIALRAFSKVKKKNYIYLICGKGILESRLRKLSKKLGIQKNVKLLGYRKDIPLICSISHVFIFPSIQEGLPVSLMEAMASGLPIIASDIRGNNDLITNGEGGFLIKSNKVNEYISKIDLIMENTKMRLFMKKINQNRINDFANNKVNDIMKLVYKNYLGE